MARFFFAPEGNVIVCDNAAHNEDFYVEKSTGYIIVNIAAENTAEYAYMPFYAVIALKDDKPEVFGNLKLINWDNGNYEVCYTLDKQAYFMPPTAVTTQNFNYGGEELRATVYTDKTAHLMMESDSATARYDIPDITNPTLYFRHTAEGALTVLKGGTIDGEYIAVLLYDTKFNMLFEKDCEKTEFSDTSFHITENMKDMLGRRRITQYTFSKKEIKSLSTKFVYKNNREYPGELLPYLMLEGVAAGDVSKTKEYLSDDIADNAGNLRGYFGDFTKIVCPKYKENKKSDLNKVALFYNDKSTIITPKYYTFTVENGKITNIND